MARLLPGPLAASVSGSVGDVTFEMTRFGMVAQQKPIPPVHLTSKAVLTKTQFGNAVRAYFKLDPSLTDKLTPVAHARHHTKTQDWISAYYRAQRYLTWEMPLAAEGAPRLVILSTVWIDPNLYIYTNLDMINPAYSAHIVVTRSGSILAEPGGLQTMLLTVPPTPIQRSSPPATWSIILFPYLTAAANSIGRSDATLGLAP